MASAKRSCSAATSAATWACSKTSALWPLRGGFSGALGAAWKAIGERGGVEGAEAAAWLSVRTSAEGDPGRRAEGAAMRRAEGEDILAWRGVTVYHGVREDGGDQFFFIDNDDAGIVLNKNC